MRNWAPNATFEELRQKLEDLSRPARLDGYLQGGIDVLYAAAWVDADACEALVVGRSADRGRDRAGHPAVLQLHGRSAHAASTPDVFAHFRHGFPRPDYKESAALIALSGTAEVSDVKTDANGYFEQDSSLDLHLKSIAPGAVDINEAELIRTYHGWFWDDRLTQMLDPGDIFSGQPAHMAAGADYHGTRGDSEWALTHYIARLRATDLRRRRAI